MGERPRSASVRPVPAQTLPDEIGRLAVVTAAAGLRPTGEPRRVASASNDTWSFDDRRYGPVILRVCWRGDVTRLRREEALGALTPDLVQVPEVVASGVIEDPPLGWSVARRLSGRTLEICWPELGDLVRREVARRLGRMLRALHCWAPPPSVHAVFTARPALDNGITGLVGADITPLPPDRAVLIARSMAELPYVNPRLVSSAVELLERLGPLGGFIDCPDRQNLVHGDLNLSNVWLTEDGEIVLLDLEWARFGPPLLDLQRLCEYSDRDVIEGRGTDRHATILSWLCEDYPEILGESRAPERMRLWSLAYAVRNVVTDPPRSVDPPLGHPVHRIRRIVDGTWPAPGAVPAVLSGTVTA